MDNGDKNEALVPEALQPSKNERTDPPRNSSIAAGLAQASALVTVFVGAIYFLGLVALWMPVARLHTKDFATALYAVSLAPRTFVAGQGVKNFLGPSLANVAYAAIIIILFLTIASVIWEIGGRNKVAFLRSGGAAGIVSAVVVLGLVLLAVCLIPERAGFSITGFDFRREGPGGSTLVSAALVVSFLGGFWGGYHIFKGLELKESQYLPYISDRRAILRELIATFALALIAAFAAAAAKAPPLPWVKTTITEDSKNIEGYLLTHSDGSWYILREDSQVLTVVQDEQIDKVQIFRKDD